MVVIRKAKASDVEAMVKLGKLMHKESPRYRDKPYCEHKAGNTARTLITLPNGCAQVAVQDNLVVGMLLGMVTEHFFSTAEYACDFIVYVLPEFRNGKAAIGLINEYELFASKRGATEFQLGVSTEVSPESTQKLYAHLGYRLAGFIMVKDNV